MLFKKFIQFIDSQKLFAPGKPVLLALSGGLDSTVMAHLFFKAGFSFAVAHCNFGLRGMDSDEDARFAANLSGDFGVDFYSEKFNTKEYAGKNGISIQMAARELRYKWFEEIRSKNGYQYIATAHHLDDQAETFLINLIRGTGIAGFHGIPVKNEKVIRPMMFSRRNEIALYAKKHSIAYREDLSNNEIKYLRNKIRHEILPAFCSINPEFTESLTQTIRKIYDYEQIAEQTLNHSKSQAIQVKDETTIVDKKLLLASPQPGAFAWFLLSPFGFNESQVASLLECLDKPEEKRFTSSTYILTKERNRLIIQPNATQFSAGLVAGSFHLQFNHITNPCGYKIPDNPEIASFDYNKLEFPLTIRKWQNGDIFHPLGMKGKKKLSDFFIDQKFTAQQKEETWLLCSGDRIVWVIGYRIDHRYRITGKTKEILVVYK
ncbi:MAG: tRNA lysidine(34) synthetase TilS [Bacteroidetes bacterium]|nr:tRNA lysidine(34) synthetase TilS [Bacteroidota bacterium]